MMEDKTVGQVARTENIGLSSYTGVLISP